MGAYSELDMERQYGDAFQEDDAFMEDSGLCVPSEDGAATAPQSAQEPVPQNAGQPQAESPSDGQAEKEANEDAKRKAHEAAEAKRKAEFDARQAAKKAAEQEQLNKLETMSTEELLSASMKRVSADTEKLTRRNMKECVAEHIQTMCIENPDFSLKVMHPRKSMVRCFQYINRKAFEYVQDELKANGFKPGPGQQMYASDVPDDLCYQWAVDYFNDPDAKEDHEEEEKFVPKPYVGGTAKSGKKAKGKTENKKEDTSKKAAAKAEAKKTAESTGQISLGDFAMPEEKAG